VYSVKVPFKDFKGNPRNQVVHFNLTETEVMKLATDFKAVFRWSDSLKAGEDRTLETEEVVEFYNGLEEIMLSAYGVPSDDGLHFRKGGRYDFQESALFNECMLMFVKNPPEAMKMLDGLLPKDMEELVRKVDDGLAQTAQDTENESLRKQIEELRAQMGGTSEQS
jgi:hypothetical protein